MIKKLIMRYRKYKLNKQGLYFTSAHGLYIDSRLINQLSWRELINEKYLEGNAEAFVIDEDIYAILCPKSSNRDVLETKLWLSIHPEGKALRTHLIKEITNNDK